MKAKLAAFAATMLALGTAQGVIVTQTDGDGNVTFVSWSTESSQFVPGITSFETEDVVDLGILGGSAIESVFLDLGSNVVPVPAINFGFLGGAGGLSATYDMASGTYVTDSSVAINGFQFASGVTIEGDATPASQVLAIGVNATAVPEPSSTALLGLGALTLLRRRRK